MIQRISPPGRNKQAGFTLIELLVVIVILGVLAATVVFAVRGVGDKGKSNAVTIDERTIRTAQESFCANEGRYGTAQELVNARLLSDLPTYNAVIPDTSGGPCGNTSYVIGPVDVGGVSCPSGQWCTAPPPNGTATNSQNRNVGLFSSPAPTQMVQLPSGRVLVAKGATNASGSGSGPVHPFQIFDPKAGSMGAWTPLAPPGTAGPTTPNGAVPNQLNEVGNLSGSHTMIVLKGGPTECGLNCGKVLVKFRPLASATTAGANAPWRLYDENASEPGTPVGVATAGSWTPLSADPVPSGPYRRVQYSSAVQLTQSPCGTACGKVLIVGQGGEGTVDSFSGPTPADPELWDPITGTFEKLGLSAGYKEFGTDAAGEPITTGLNNAPSLTLLDNGKVLSVSGPDAQLFDPIAKSFTDLALDPPAAHSWLHDTTVKLPNGKVLLTSNGSASNPLSPSAMLFDSNANSWTPKPSCGDGSPSGSRYCHTLATLPDGRVLAKRTNDRRITGAINTQPAQIFDPVTEAWTSPTPAAPIPHSVHFAVPIKETQPGSCASLCNRVLAGGRVTGTVLGTASIYTP